MFTVFEVGDRQYQLRFTANAVCELERLAGRGLHEIMDGGEISGLRLLLWGGLLHQGNMTLQRCGEIIDGYIAQYGSVDGLCVVLKKVLEQAGFSPAGEPLGELQGAVCPEK